MVTKRFLDKIAIRKKQGVKRKLTKPPKWLFPTNAEKNYDKALYSLVKDLKDLIKKYLVPEIPSMLAEVERKMPQDRQDDYLDRLNSLIIFIRGAIQNKVNNTILYSGVIAGEISRFNKRQFQKINESVFGIDIFLHEPWLGDQLELFASQNAELITSLPDEELKRVSSDIQRGLQQGTRYSDLTKTIQKSFGISHRKAKLIARDQTTKLNSSLTRLRQQEAGVEEYTWQTVEDERVRKTHRHNNGKRFRWDNPPPVTGHPGNDVNCRCVAVPVLEGLEDI
jgi:SPP1 gp7 family putative phage head morphogenesis protein